MDNTFNEDDFTDNRNLQARETETSCENPSRDIVGSIHIDEALIEKTRGVWESVYGRKITDTEAVRIIERFADIFDVLTECMRSNDPGVSKPDGEVSYG